MMDSFSGYFDQFSETSGDSFSGDHQGVNVPENNEKLAYTDGVYPWDSHIFLPYAVEAVITPEPAVGSQVDCFVLSHDDRPAIPEYYLDESGFGSDLSITELFTESVPERYPKSRKIFPRNEQQASQARDCLSLFAPPLITPAGLQAITSPPRTISATQKPGKRWQANNRGVGGNATVNRTLPTAERMPRHNLQLMEEFGERIGELNQKGLPQYAELLEWHQTRYSEAINALKKCSQDDVENARDKMDNTLHLLHEYLEWKHGASGDWSLRVEQWNTNPRTPQNALPRNATMSPCFLRRKPPHPPPQLTFNLTPKLCFPTPCSFEPSPAQNTPIFLASLHPIATPSHSNVFNQSALTPVSADSSNLRAQCHHTHYTKNSRRSSI